LLVVEIWLGASGEPRIAWADRS